MSTIDKVCSIATSAVSINTENLLEVLSGKDYVLMYAHGEFSINVLREDSSGIKIIFFSGVAFPDAERFAKDLGLKEARNSKDVYLWYKNLPVVVFTKKVEGGEEICFFKHMKK